MIDQDTFKNIMAAAPGPATVVTATGADGRHQGLTMSAVCSVSLDPPLVLACLDHGSNTLAAVRESGSFTVNYIARGHEDIAMRFAVKSGSKFNGLAFEVFDDNSGGPVLHDHVAAYAVCRVEQMHTSGDHTIVIGHVVRGAAHRDSHALAYARREFFTAATAQV
ncbi:flavin reductase family protein [Gordonia sp. zg691]|uniref:Flavin reductase family protein n=1 Tax=Gordonia jinghuaiqii TaxID=2758710 RepID=A0A7D7LWV3_9ACTN|nr:flavin reductase family protein [Gordonia jinghuaiqii]MBD0862930.1 flavin reductase family protein [Gordonia jinghuaiqii]MCR5978945.1 flavin reductase [Gordonia jinghuaiqii]QMT01718.1 flavin reductase family protein [Gordonia jinghuaiqii]